MRGEGEGPGKAAVGDVDLGKLGVMGPPELVLLLEHPKARRAAALELCKRGDAELVEALWALGVAAGTP